MVFNLKDRQCLSEFYINIDELVSISLNVTSSDRRRGELTYDLSTYTSPEGVCSVSGEIYGTNDFGNSTPVDIQLPEGKSYNVTG